MESVIIMVCAAVAKTGTIHSGLLLGNQIILCEYKNDYWKPLVIYRNRHLFNFILIRIRQIAKEISIFKWLLGNHLVKKNKDVMLPVSNSAYLNCAKSTARQILL